MARSLLSGARSGHPACPRSLAGCRARPRRPSCVNCPTRGHDFPAFPCGPPERGASSVGGPSRGSGRSSGAAWRVGRHTHPRRRRDTDAPAARLGARRAVCVGVSVGLVCVARLGTASRRGDTRTGPAARCTGPPSSVGNGSRCRVEAWPVPSSWGSLADPPARRGLVAIARARRYRGSRPLPAVAVRPSWTPLTAL